MFWDGHAPMSVSRRWDDVMRTSFGRRFVAKLIFIFAPFSNVILELMQTMEHTSAA